MGEVRSAGQYLAASIELLRANWWRAALAFLVATAANTTLDLTLALDESYSALASTLLLSLLVDLVLEFELTFALLRQNRVASGPADWRRFGPMILLGLIATAGIWLGMLLFVLPAFYLSVRWVLTVPILLGERTSVVEAFRKSWQQTSGIFWPVFAALAVAVFLPTIAAILASFLWEGSETSPSSSLALNALGSASTVFSWHLAMAVYLIRRPGPQLTKVFA